MIDVHGGNGHRRAVVRGRGDDVLVGGHLRGDLDADVGLALVVAHDELVLVLGVGVGVAQAHREVGGVAPADAVRRHAAGERADEAHLHLVLGGGGAGGKAERQCCRGDRAQR